MISSAIVSCSETDAGEAQQGMQKFAIDTLYTHVDYETDDLARPVSIDLLPDGQLAVLDNQLKQIRLYDTDGSLVRSMGRGGEGPGEFERPAYILWRKMGDYPQQIVKVNREGRIEATFMLPEMEDLFLNSLAVSEDESTVYLGSSGTATIYRATLATTHREQTGTD